jgi:hypothetical protein
MAATNRPKVPEWTPNRLKQAIRSGSSEQDIAILKRIGLLTADGKLNKAAQSWGGKPSRTPEIE